jgi:cell division septation protein DedD
MRRLPPALLLTLWSAALLLASCSENKPAASASPKGTRKLIPSNLTSDSPELGSSAGAANTPGQLNSPGRSETSGGDPAAARPQPAATPAINTSELPDAPAGSQWTLYCQTLKGPGHVERAEEVRQQLIRSTGMKSWYVIHTAEASNLYYGFYRAIDASDRSDNRKDGQQAQRDRQRIDGMKDADGERPFARCMFVELTAPDPEAPADWNLANAPQDGFWSVQIAAYEHSPDRKKYAVDAVRDARARGVQAFFHHGPSVSSVCVGSWPMEAVRYDVGRGMAGDAQRDLIVFPEGLPPLKRNIKDKQGRPMEVAEKTVEIVDPTLTATLLQYPTHAINGVVRIIKGKNRKGEAFERPEPSFMVRIPNRFISGERVNDLVNPDAPAAAGDGFSFLRPRNQPREPSKYDYIPGQRAGSGQPR